MSSLSVNLTVYEIDYLRQKISKTSTMNLSDTRIRSHEVVLSTRTELKELLRNLRARAAIFSDEEILEEIKKWREEKKH
ncbi:MAG: hypothetical protein ACTSX9_01000 [Candidatus Njordarchaeales archaeon]